MKTFLKWAGNKSSVVDKIAPYLIGETLIEPFSGSCAVSLNSSFKNYICNDINADMINMYHLVQNNAEDYIEKVKTLFKNGNDRERYNELRTLYNTTTNKDLKSEIFLYLNRHCFNGLCRYNKKGEFNTPFGSYTSPYFPEKELSEFHNYTKNTFEFLSLDFSEIFLRADSKTVIYCDPPYLKLTDTADFTNYAKDGFNYANHLQLRDLAIQYSSEAKSTVIISNHDTSETRDLYKDANEIVSFNVKRTISSKATNRTQAPELLAIYRVK